MGSWPGKTVIGLTGNIGTGKSVVRRMLEHLGAYGIDADALANRAIMKGSPAYQPVVDMFGRWILGPDEQIDQAKLARMVFADPEALGRLEAIIHPLVGQAIDIFARRATQSVVVIEAIKLFESGLASRCDTVWVTTASQELQLQRLVQKRGMSEAAAMQRIQAQGSPQLKIDLANVVIRNEGSFEDTWGQVYDAWSVMFPSTEEEQAAEDAARQGVAGEVVVQRARPRDAAEIATLITQYSGGKRQTGRGDIMAAFGEKAFLLLRVDGRALGVVGWKVENLVAQSDDVFIDPSLPAADALSALMNEVERVSKELQCEISLLFLPPDAIAYETALLSLGYQRKALGNLGVRVWEEVAQESMPAGSLMLFKQLRQDRVLKPV